MKCVSYLQKAKKLKPEYDAGLDNDVVNHPKHYEDAAVLAKFEPIDLARRYSFAIGNAIKYILRAPYKGNEKQDLEKAKWYLDRAWLKFFDLSTIDLTINYIKPNANLLDTFIINSFKLNNKYIRLLILDDNGLISRESIEATTNEITKYLKSVV